MFISPHLDAHTQTLAKIKNPHEHTLYLSPPIQNEIPKRPYVLGGRSLNVTFPAINASTVLMLEVTTDSHPCRPWIIDRITAQLKSPSQEPVRFDSGYSGTWLCLATGRRPIKLTRNRPPTTESMRLAYAIQVNENPLTFDRTFRRLYDTRDWFCVNIAPTATQHARESVMKTLTALAGAPLPDNVVVTEMAMEPVTSTQLDGTLLMMRILLDMGTHATHTNSTIPTSSWQFFLSLPDTHFPLHSRKTLVEFLVSKPHRNFVSAFGTKETRALQIQHSASKLPDAWPLDGMEYRAGSGWAVLSHGFVSDVVEHLGGSVTGKVLDSNFRMVGAPLRPYQLIKLVLASVTHPFQNFFLMALVHGPYAETWVNDDLRVWLPWPCTALTSDSPPRCVATTLDLGPNRTPASLTQNTSHLFLADINDFVNGSLALADALMQSSESTNTN
eukprot:c17697_g1_i1.p1 GENE.c17697_g1_i1~~c17697_g1_i1.p1  ORF type:complete len:444 (+),score=86.09 c17697_g1_i1:585-1916(+)